MFGCGQRFLFCPCCNAAPDGAAAAAAINMRDAVTKLESCLEGLMPCSGPARHEQASLTLHVLAKRGSRAARHRCFQLRRVTAFWGLSRFPRCSFAIRCRASRSCPALTMLCVPSVRISCTPTCTRPPSVRALLPPAFGPLAVPDCSPLQSLQRTVWALLVDCWAHGGCDVMWACRRWWSCVQPLWPSSWERWRRPR